MAGATPRHVLRTTEFGKQTAIGFCSSFGEGVEELCRVWQCQFFEEAAVAVKRGMLWELWRWVSQGRRGCRDGEGHVGGD